MKICLSLKEDYNDRKTKPFDKVAKKLFSGLNLKWELWGQKGWGGYLTWENHEDADLFTLAQLQEYVNTFSLEDTKFVVYFRDNTLYLEVANDKEALKVYENFYSYECTKTCR